MRARVLALLAVAQLLLRPKLGLAENDPGASQTKRLVPTLGVETGEYSERLAVELGGGELSDTRSLWVTRIDLGLAYPLTRERPRALSLRGQSSVGIGLVYEVGQWPLHVRQELLVAYPATLWLSLELGLGTGFQLNLTNPSLSYWEVGLPVGVKFANIFELVYYPMLTVALGSDQTPVFGGTKSRGVNTGLAPLNLCARFHFRGLAF